MQEKLPFISLSLSLSLSLSFSSLLSPLSSLSFSVHIYYQRMCIHIHTTQHTQNTQHTHTHSLTSGGFLYLVLPLIPHTVPHDDRIRAGTMRGIWVQARTRVESHCDYGRQASRTEVSFLPHTHTHTHIRTALKVYCHE